MAFRTFLQLHIIYDESFKKYSALTIQRKVCRFQTLCQTYEVQASCCIPQCKGLDIKNTGQLNNIMVSVKASVSSYSSIIPDRFSFGVFRILGSLFLIRCFIWCINQDANQAWDSTFSHLSVKRIKKEDIGKKSRISILTNLVEFLDYN